MLPQSAIFFDSRSSLYHVKTIIGYILHIFLFAVYRQIVTLLKYFDFFRNFLSLFTKYSSPPHFMNKEKDNTEPMSYNRCHNDNPTRAGEKDDERPTRPPSFKKPRTHPGIDYSQPKTPTRQPNLFCRHRRHQHEWPGRNGTGLWVYRRRVRHAPFRTNRNPSRTRHPHI